MIPPPLRVVLDANLLFPFTLRDTLLRAAAEGMYQAYWSAEILDEATRNLVAREAMSLAQADRLRAAIGRAFPESLVSGYEPLVSAIGNDPRDRHVAAAAVHARAHVIVTFNLSDFQVLPQGLEAMSPDELLCSLYRQYADEIVRLLARQASHMRRPPWSFTEILRALERVAPQFAAAVRERTSHL